MQCVWASEGIYCGEEVLSRIHSGCSWVSDPCLPGAVRVAEQRGELRTLVRRLSTCLAAALPENVLAGCVGIRVESCIRVTGDAELCVVKPVAVAPALRLLRYLDPTRTVFLRGYAFLDIDELVDVLTRVVADRLGVELRRLRGGGSEAPRRVAGSGKHPPCIENILASIDRGDEVPHHARFALATYLIARGYTVEQVVDVFRKVPDFNEKVTRYQVEHIAGMRGGGKRYSVPSCGWMRTHGLCPVDRDCGVGSPRNYGTRARRRKIELA